MNEKDKVIQFLKENPGIFIEAVSKFYPLSIGFMERYKDLLKWDSVINKRLIKIDLEFCMRFRNKIDWHFFEPWWSGEEFFQNVESDLVDVNFLEEFKNELNWSQLCYSGSNELLSEENIERFYDRIDFQRLSSNFRILFTEKLIDKYKDKWEWESLSFREDLPWSSEFILKYKDKWYWEYLKDIPEIPWTEEILDMASLFLSDEEIEILGNKHVDILDDNDDDNVYEYDDEDDDKDENLMEQKTHTYSPEEFARILNDFNPAQYSSDIRIPWSIALIDYYKDEWDWKKLSCNEYLPWSEELIDRYFDYWYWGDKIPRKNGIEDDSDELVINFGLSENNGISWTNSMILKYRDYLVWHFFAYNEGIDWSIDLLIEHQLRIARWRISKIKNLWEKVFLPYLDEEIISGILEEKRKEIMKIEDFTS